MPSLSVYLILAKSMVGTRCSELNKKSKDLCVILNYNREEKHIGVNWRPGLKFKYPYSHGMCSTPPYRVSESLGWYM